MTKRNNRRPKPPLMINGECTGDECASWRPRTDGTDYCSVVSTDIKRLDACPLKKKWQDMRGTEKVTTLDEFKEGKKDGTA